MSALSDAVQAVLDVVRAHGPVTAAEVEAHPRVVEVCRRTKTKARRHIERLARDGVVMAFGDRKPALWVAQDRQTVRHLGATR